MQSARQSLELDTEWADALEGVPQAIATTLGLPGLLLLNSEAAAISNGSTRRHVLQQV